MRIGYGFGRTSEDFARAKVERLYLDTAFTDRSERTDLLQRDMRAGDVVVLLAAGDLGQGTDLRAVRRRLKAAGVTVEVLEAEKQRKQRGRPAKFNPTPDQDEQIRKLWYMDGIYMMKHVIQRAEEIYGKPVTRNQLDHRYGPRDGSMPDGRVRD